MTQSLIDKLIKHYEDSIALIQATEDKNTIEDILTNRKINYGLCYCAKEVFDEEIYEDKWIKSKSDRNGFIYEIPLGEEKETAIECLQYRVDIMKTFSETEQ